MCDAVYHGALGFFKSVNLFLSTALYFLCLTQPYCRRLHSYIRIHKSIIGLLKQSIFLYATNSKHCNLRLETFNAFSFPAVQTEAGTKAFSNCPFSTFNKRQQNLELCS
ncbi:hypothetical protein XENOCAPTIV_025447 [Xenoophorus captivus]|uniref:Uncharacterized protein n=1 Tax=Xenoophorus captivus TaxID=1517983 RepID=A0ABV0S357_9TELE